MISRNEMFHVLFEMKGQSRDKKQKHLQNYIINKLGIENKEEMIKSVKREVTFFGLKVFTKYDKVCRITELFLKENSKWLEKKVSFQIPAGTSAHKDVNDGASNFDRSIQNFTCSSDRSKRRKTSELRKSTSTIELMYATQMKLRSEGNHVNANIVKQLYTMQSQTDQNLLARNVITSYTADEALAMIIGRKLTKDDYMKIRLGAKKRSVNLYPPYSHIINAKARCYPPEKFIKIDDQGAEVSLQALLDHTASRIITISEPVLNTLPNALRNLVLISKWGFDGSSGQSQYKQKLNSKDIEHFSDSDLFLTSLVPLELHVETSDPQFKNIVWKNSRPSSTRFCRPVRFRFVKESTEISTKEVAHIQSQIDNLVPSEVKCAVGNVSISHKMVLTMIDGKVCNAITSTSSQTCYICSSTPKMMNDIDKALKRAVNTSTLRFGLSTLHSWIRFFEYFLHVSYRLKFQKWQARTEADKASLAETKKCIQQKFKSQLGLLIDIPKTGGSGTTNDGNTARRFFQDAAISSDITGIDPVLITRCGIILQTMSSGFAINSEAFEKYAIDTARLCVDKYEWYPMPPSVHKVLIHGAMVIRDAPLPIGQLSEEAQESRNKDFKNIREHNTRKFSRVAANTDLFHVLLASSDPHISSLEDLPNRKLKSLSGDVRALLQEPAL